MKTIEIFGDLIKEIDEEIVKNYKGQLKCQHT